MPPKPTKQNEILHLLAKYGVMSSRTVWELLDRKISYPGVRQHLNSLERRKLIVRPTGLIGGYPIHFWMLSRESDAFSRISAITGFTEAELKQKKMRYTHFPHEDLCTLFQFSIERSSRGLKVLRGKDTRYFHLPKHLLSERVQQNGYCPDLCIGVPCSEGAIGGEPKFYRWVAVEIDRSYRSAIRLASRLNIYSRHTSFCGVLYFMPSESTAAKLHKIYANRKAKDSVRISGTKEFFLATATVQKSPFDPSSLMLQLSDVELSLSAWLAIFAVVEPHKRDAFVKSIPDGVI